jgi:hypothetical protein
MRSPKRLLSELATTTGSPTLPSERASDGLGRSLTLLAASGFRLMRTRPENAGQMQNEHQQDRSDGDRDSEHDDPA